MEKNLEPSPGPPNCLKDTENFFPYLYIHIYKFHDETFKI